MFLCWDAAKPRGLTIYKQDTWFLLHCQWKKTSATLSHLFLPIQYYFITVILCDVYYFITLMLCDMYLMLHSNVKSKYYNTHMIYNTYTIITPFKIYIEMNKIANKELKNKPWKDPIVNFLASCSEIF